MRVPTEWLKQYVDCGLSPQDLAETLIDLGIGLEEMLDAPAGLGGQVLVTEITPNRGDLLSLWGTAREVAAATGGVADLPEPSVAHEGGESIVGQVTVELADPDLCPRYSARVVRGVKPGPSPQWMQDRLLAMGQRPIDILVDVTNYVMFELGQPLHAFDFGKLGNRIVVRRARPGEVIETLDGAERILTDQQLLITDGERGVALAGVMGGANTEVTAETTDILLEAAHFHGPNIRRTARSLGLESESSYRFARTVDPNLTIAALNRAAQLLAEHAGGTVAPGIIDQKAHAFESRHVTLRPERCNRFLGTTLTIEEMGEYLASLGLRVEPEADHLVAVVPTRRPDLEREVDLIEEIARLHGYNRVPMSTPPPAQRTGRLSERQQTERRVRELLLGYGLNEVWTFSLTNPAAMARANMAADLAKIGAVEVLNALSEDYNVMRWSMLPSMLEVVSRNQAMHGEPVRVFEVGRTYAGLDPELTDAQAHEASRVVTGRTAESLPLPAVEERTIAGALTGRSLTSAWNVPEGELAADFYEAKGILEVILAELAIDGVRCEPCEEAIFEPGRAARMLHGEKVVAVVGEVAADVRERLDLRTEVVVFEADLGWLLDTADLVRTYRTLPRHPAALRDLALVVADAVPAGQVEAVIRQAAGPLLESLRLFDVYRGQGLPEGKRSLAYNLRFRHPDRTLTDDEVDAVVTDILHAAEREAGATLRE